MSEHICQSCGMPMDSEDFGTDADGAKNKEYCHYCFKKGKFTEDVSLEAFIEQSLPFFLKEAKTTEEEARKQLQQFFPMLRRWKKKI
ncbi:zinc ribbon domain-containing protein [Endomicrobium proavitum]|uniref:Putative zinc ribbon domain-containing protein n=1 Tax=Endomicrobium proavitum TaxID=1408281 RepID=A0A0G3WK56_9BACT|nr:zinc ribbon domain-containing protein [Endomicrobium proavitum]AKL97884.1 hypothetical protein Epro_0505 [Endomicrobium proavitum]